MLSEVRTSVPPVLPIVDALRAAVLAAPHRLAIDDGNVHLSRLGLYVNAIRLAHRLTETVAASTPVGLYLGNDSLFLVAALGCVLAGCPHVTFDLRHPPARNRELLERAGIGALIEGSERFQSDLADISCPRLNVDALPIGDEDAMEALPVAPRILELDAPFVFLFTSGSTGSPKAVVHSQRSYAHNYYADVTALQLCDEDRSLNILSPATVSGLRAALATLYSGSVSFPRDPRLGLSRIVDTMRDERITVFRCVPALMRALLTHDGIRDAMRDLRVFHMGGERVYRTDIDLLRPLLPESCRISIGFGSTESGFIAQWFVDDSSRGVVRSGYATPGTTLQIVSPDGTPLRTGETGELRSAGPLTAIGFWDGKRTMSGGLDAVPDDASSRVCFTGDLFRQLENGLLEHAGRADRMLKLRGQRIDLGDVEAAVRACRGVRDTAIVATTSGRNATKIAAFVVGDRTIRHSTASLRRELRARLPEHMLPASVHLIAAIPQLPGYKPDVAALERLASFGVRKRSRKPKHEVARSADTGAVVANVWSNLLGSASVARDERWEDSGGDSLQMLQLAYGIERLLRKPIPIDTLWPQMNARELADRLDGRTIGDIPATNARCVVMIPGINGDEPKLVEFRKLLGRGFRYFVPLYPTWEALVDEETTFDGIVEHVIAQIRQNVEERPLAIVGYSFGGYVAHEVARRLGGAGEEVAFVGILDSKIVATERLDPDDTFMRKVMRDLRSEGLRKAIALRIGHGIALAVSRSNALRRAVARSRTGLPLPAEISFPFDFKMTRFVREALSSAWRPGILSVSTTLYRSESYPLGTARDLGWGPHALSLAIDEVGGLHDTMIVGSHGETLARKLRDAIEAHLP